MIILTRTVMTLPSLSRDFSTMPASVKSASFLILLFWSVSSFSTLAVIEECILVWDTLFGMNCFEISLCFTEKIGICIQWLRLLFLFCQSLTARFNPVRVICRTVEHRERSQRVARTSLTRLLRCTVFVLE